jgi:hypothetical protein
MTKINNQIEDALSLVEQNLEFLHVGMFLNYYAKNNDLSSKVVPIKFECIGDSPYTLTGELAKDALHIYFNQQKPTVFGYLVMWNSCRGIAMALYEVLKHESPLKDFMKKKLGGRYEHYHAILSFIRHQLSHNIQNEILLKKEDYEQLRTKFKGKCPSGVAAFSIKYADDFPELNAPENYEFKFEVDFTSLTPAKRFIEIISECQLFLFSELCSHFVVAFRKELKSKA